MGVPNPETDPQFYTGVPMRRFVAFIIDFAVICVLSFIVLVMAAVIVAMTAGVTGPLMFIAFTGCGFFYRWILLVKRSATLGMILTGIEVRDYLGSPMRPGPAFVHTAGFYVTFFFPPLLIIGWFLMATSPYRRTMHDIVMNAVVINRPT